MVNVAFEIVINDLMQLILRDRPARQSRHARIHSQSEAMAKAVKHLEDMAKAKDILIDAADSINIAGQGASERLLQGLIKELEAEYKFKTKTAQRYFVELAAKYVAKVRAIVAIRQPLTPLIPRDVPPPKDGKYSYGYDVNVHASVPKVFKAASAETSHWTGHLDAKYPVPGPQRFSRESWSQNSRWLYSTYELALKAARVEMAWEFAEALAKVDAMIEQQQKPTEWAQANDDNAS